MYISWLLAALSIILGLCSLEESQEGRTIFPSSAHRTRRVWEAPKVSESPCTTPEFFMAQHPANTLQTEVQNVICTSANTMQELMKWGLWAHTSLSRGAHSDTAQVSNKCICYSSVCWFTTSSWQCLSSVSALISKSPSSFSSLSLCKFVHLYNTCWLIYHMVKI